MSNDGGIDGYGYHVDADDFEQPEWLFSVKDLIQIQWGAMNKYQADYGVFITNSRFTNKAREAAEKVRR